MFVGSSANHLPTARALKNSLSEVAEVVVWDEPGAGFEFNESVFGGLLLATEKFDFAVFVFEADDLANIRRHNTESEPTPVVRDNVIFEFGLFVGSIGRSRAYWISPAGITSPELPTDLAGLVHLTFSSQGNSDSNGMPLALDNSVSRLAD